MCTTWSGIIDSSVGTASPLYDSAAYGSSSTISRFACFAILASSWRRASGMRRPVGFWKFGSTYRKRAPSSIFGVSADGTSPSSSEVTETKFGSNSENACSAPRYVGVSTSTLLPASISVLPSRSSPCCEPVVTTTFCGSMWTGPDE